MMFSPTITSFFSVIIPLYNKEAYIKNTLESVINQTFKNYEVIIVNDGSTDNSLDVVKSINDKRIKIFSQKNKGVSATRNFGISKSMGEYIALLDADDYWHENHLECLHKSIKLFPKEVWFSNAYYVKRTTQLITKANYNLNFNSTITLVKDYFKACKIDALAWTSATAFKKSAFINLGMFNETIFSGIEDIDLWIRFGLKHPIVFNSTYTSIYSVDILNSLSKETHLKGKYELFNFYGGPEFQENISFKNYVNLNKYALAVKCKLLNNKEVLKKLTTEIDTKSLNFKQKLILNSPRFLVSILKKTQRILTKNRVYISSYS